ncbi:hypothetical protein HBA43_20765 [Providencia rettgeri]|uniref:hypothetical protein n=1 Tax=Providencia TaxID=586 RepID=UPI001419380B|nr:MULTISPECIES: hypothetical protein [Providencia]EJD6499775.1 hypothetical protein [Providencia rettgeri]EJD6541450.1 hypothetical protein [Providencia rettgeri]EJD6643120.1 hypothetical protein [Providencia rettgeri]ELL9155584.1 hypothetical protein [Providencia rettgeri]ELR5048876.1 hypothetical protein [Providencia rettgeri]
MNKNELQVLIDYTKGMIADNKEPEKKVIIALCDELERINNLHPVAFITQEAANRMNDGIVSNVYVTKDKSPAFNTPIFIQK